VHTLPVDTLGMTESSDDDTDVFKIVMIVVVSILGALLIIENCILCIMCCRKGKASLSIRSDAFSDDSAKLEEFIKEVE